MELWTVAMAIGAAGGCRSRPAERRRRFIVAARRARCEAEPDADGGGQTTDSSSNDPGDEVIFPARAR